MGDVLKRSKTGSDGIKRGASSASVSSAGPSSPGGGPHANSLSPKGSLARRTSKAYLSSERAEGAKGAEVQEEEGLGEASATEASAKSAAQKSRIRRKSVF